MIRRFFRLLPALLTLCLAASLSLPATAQEGVLRNWQQRNPTLPVTQAYGAHGLQPFWLQQGVPTPQAEAMVSILVRAAERGLEPGDYDAARLVDWLGRLRSGQTGDGEGFDLALSIATLRFADHLHRGRINIATPDLGIQLARKKPLDAVQWLPLLSQSADPAARLDELEPGTVVYRALKDALHHYREQAQRSVLAPPIVLDQKSLKPGDSAEQVPFVRARLRTLGYLDSTAAEDLLYDPAMAEAVRRFQSDAGLEPDGAVGVQTLRQLNVTPMERVNQLRLGLERLRWLPSAWEGPFIIVNIPSFRLYAFEGGAPDLARPAIAMDVIVGQALGDHHTPVFHADMAYVVFHPHWNVPYSIARKELLPLIQRDPTYLARHDMEIVGAASPEEDDGSPDSEDSLGMLSSGRWRLRQRPGPGNSLGPIKFVFPNMNSVYLHGTPLQRLFQRARRDFSHGCIRVADPTGLAEFVLKREKGWDRQRIETGLAGSKSMTVSLSKPIPVYILYTTVVAIGDGKPRFLPDIYGQDATLLKRLNQEG